MHTPERYFIYICLLALIPLIGSCGGKNVEREIDRLNTRLTALDQRMRVIEQWTQVQRDAPTRLVDSAPAEATDAFAALEAQLHQTQIRLHQTSSRVSMMNDAQQQIQLLMDRLTALELQIAHLMMQDTQREESAETSPPLWLHKVVWEENGVIYAVGSSANRNNGQEFALLNARNALLEYLGVQVVTEVQVLERYHDNRKTYVLVSRGHPVKPD